MAFDQSTRNRLQKFVSETRSILTEEFTRQLQASYGMDPKNGTIAELDTLNFLDNQGRETATILRETLAHYVTGLSGKSEKEGTKQAVERIIREQAFTVLNRLGALRMAEARGFLIESIAKGYSSKGFQLYKNLAGTALGETGDAYRQYLFGLFDEFSLDLAVLFDRHSSQGRLFPRESALLALLDQINHFEIEHLWAEDETIGWIYQYFNSQEERKKMRAESQAPRNSRELAVRNQFFTPRYVVEFLTDNTLGRIWYEMTQGKTALVENCRYLVRRPNEIFLPKGESAPNSEAEDQESLSQEELLKQPLYIPFRAIKDPRELRMLDPACGSMHFGLYAFDLFEKIYEEAWQLESELTPEAFSRPKGLEPLQTTYSNFDEFRKAIPKLIIECNIHGVDIDPRAVQIAGLSLWQRAQRAWHQMGIKPNQRPTINKSNIVCAEPMPGEREMLREFTSNLNPPVLGQLVETIFDKMELAGEAGTLLKIEEEIASTINKAKDEFNKELLRRKEEQGYIPGFAPKREATLFDFAELTDETSFWDTAEERILEALSTYADQAESRDGQKRLFAEDAAKGFAFIDLCRKRFDVVLMNPPYGDASPKIKKYLQIEYKGQPNDLFSCFFERSVEISDYIGSLTSRTFLFFSSFEKLRTNFLFAYKQIKVLADLGFGVLDGALVETCAMVLNCKTKIVPETVFFRLNEEPDKQPLLENFIDDLSIGFSHDKVFLVHQKLFQTIEGSPMPYSFGRTILNRLITYPSMYPQFMDVRLGAVTSDNDQFLRLRWEVDAQKIDPLGGWASYAKGGDYSKYFGDIHLLIKWNGDGEFIKVTSGSAVRLRELDQYLKPGLTYPLVTVKGMNLRILPADCVFDNGSPSLFKNRQGDRLLVALGVLNSRIAELYVRCFTSSRHWQVGYVRKIPWPSIKIQRRANEIESLVQKAVMTVRCFYDFEEPSTEYLRPWLFFDGIPDSFSQGCDLATQKFEELRTKFKQIEDSLDRIVFDCFEFTEKEWSIVEREIPRIEKYRDQFAAFEINPKKLASATVSWLVGCSFGRWDVLQAFNKSCFEKDFNVFEKLHRCSPGALQNVYGLPMKVNELDIKYPLSISWHGIVEDDEFQDLDIIKKINKTLAILFQDKWSAFDADMCEKLCVKNLRDYMRSPSGFFNYHLGCYSKSRRQAPIYWPLQTPSGSYTLWLYYHHLTEQTLYTCVNDFVEPKLKTVTDDLNGLRNKSARSSAEEKELAKLSDLEVELKDFRDELLRLAKFWKPNLNDGVQITAAPLWKLFQHKQWQKKLKETWEQLEKGEYDWAHLAYSIWPERVLRKCHEDRSLAIAHDVEDDFWDEIEVPVVRRGKDTGETKFEWQPKQLSETQLRELIWQKIAEAK